MNEEVLLVPLAAIAMPVVLVPTVMAFRHAARKREYQHRERMKALETGQPVPGEAAWPAAVACMAIGAGVPLGSFLLTWLSVVTAHNLPGEVWVAPSVVSVFALFSACGVASNLGRRRPAAAKADDPAAKHPMYDPDAYDVVGARG